MTTTSGCVGADRRDDRLELHLGQQLDRRVDEAEPLRAQRDLLDRFLAGHVERAAARRRARRIACSSSVDLPMPGSPPSSTTPPGDQAAAQHAIEFREPGRDARVLLRLDACRARARPTSPGDALEARRRGRGDGLDERVPRAAVRTLALPLRAPGRRTRCSCRRSSPWPRSAPESSVADARARRACTTAVPSLPTTTPAAWLAMRTAIGQRRARARAARRASRSRCRPRPRRRRPRAPAPESSARRPPV